MSEVDANLLVLEFDNILADHLAADRLYYRSTFWWKADKIVALLLIAAGVFLVVAAGIRWWTIVWFPLAFAEWFNLLSPRPLQVRVFFNRNPKFLETYHLSFSDAGIHFKTRSLDSRIAWTHYARVLENNRVILLIYGKNMYTVIPKRAFSDSSQYAALMSLLRRHVPDSGPMKVQLLAERVRAMIPRYEKMFSERRGSDPSDPLQFHLYHLARYWSRLVGFCRANPSRSAAFIETDLGACVQVGSEFADKLIRPDSPLYGRWQDCWIQTQAVLHKRPVTIEAVEAASRAFDACLAELRYDPWANISLQATVAPPGS